MLPTLLLALAPLLLVAEASVLPSVHARADGVLEVACEGGQVTKTVTVNGSAPQTTAPPAQTEHHSPVGTTSSISRSGNAPGSTTSSAKGNNAPSVVQSSTQPAHTGGSGAPSSGYKNILYFTNWYGYSPWSS
jgi:hypothetical protein